MYFKMVRYRGNGKKGAKLNKKIIIQILDLWKTKKSFSV